MKMPSRAFSQNHYNKTTSTTKPTQHSERMKSQLVGSSDKAAITPALPLYLHIPCGILGPTILQE
jgi:hypothetical protein